jgi:hypothetical protein
MRDWNERNGKVSEVSRESRSRESLLSRDFRRLRLKLVLRGREGFSSPKNLQKNRNALKKTTRISRARKTTGLKEGTFERDSYSFSSSSREKRERECAKRERRNVPWWQKCNFLSLRVRGRRKEKSEREKRKNKKKLIYENEWKKAKQQPTGIHVEKKERGRPNEGNWIPSLFKHT